MDNLKSNNSREGAGASSGFIARYPEGHAKAGEPQTRVAECRCRVIYDQVRVSPKWLAGLDDGARAKFLEGCERTLGGAIYIPAECGTCTRNTIRGTP